MSILADTLVMTPIPTLATMTAAQVVMAIRRARTAAHAANAVASSERVLAAAKAARS